MLFKQIHCRSRDVYRPIFTYVGRTTQVTLLFLFSGLLTLSANSETFSKNPNRSVIADSDFSQANVMGLSRISTGSDWQQVSASSDFASISEGGRFVVFTSSADDLISDDDNDVVDVFLKDTQTGLVRRLSQDENGIGGNGISDMPVISADGRYALFSSTASNLTADDSNGFRDIFLANLQTGELTRLTHGNGHSDSPSITADGKTIVFSSKASDLVDNDKNGLKDIFSYHLVSETTERVSTGHNGASGNGSSYGGMISANGQFIVFRSGANNLVEHDNNGVHDVFQKNLQTGVITRFSVSQTGVEGHGLSRDVAVSANGRYLVFSSEADNLVDNDSNTFEDIFVKDTWTGAIHLVSKKATGEQGNGPSYHAAVSQNGRYVIFSSQASNLVEDDNNGLSDIFIKDLQSRQVARINISDADEQSFRRNAHPQLSATGKYLLFASDAPNLVANDTNNARDVFRVINPLLNESADSDGDGLDDLIEQRLGTDEHDSDSDDDSLSDSDEVGIDGNYDGVDHTLPPPPSNNHDRAVDTNPLNPDSDGDGFFDIDERLFFSDPLDPRDIPVTIFRVNTSSSSTQANFSSFSAKISANGRFVVFSSDADNLVPGDNNDQRDIFVKDLHTGILKVISTASDGTLSNGNSFAPAISADGRYFAFESSADNLTTADTNSRYDIFVKDLQTGNTVLASQSEEGTQTNRDSSSPALSAHGRYLVFTSSANNLVIDDTNNASDVFIKDLQTGTLSRINTSSDGAAANRNSKHPAISADGNYVAFASYADNLVTGDTNQRYDIFVKNLVSGELLRVSTASDGTQSNGHSYSPAMSEDGRYVAFYSYASNLVPADTNNLRDIFIKDLQTGTLTRVNTASDDTQANALTDAPSLSADGRYVAFNSYANNLVANDVNDKPDVFVKDLLTGTLTLISTAEDGSQSNQWSSSPAINADGRYVTFISLADNLVSDDTNNHVDIFRVIIPWFSCCSN